MGRVSTSHGQGAGDGKVIPLSPEQMKKLQPTLIPTKDAKQQSRNNGNSESNIPNLPTTVEALPSLPDFSDAACLDLDPNFEPSSVAGSGGPSSNGSNGLGLTIHSLVDSSRLSIGDFMDNEPLTCVQDRIMQVDGAFDDVLDDDDDNAAMLRQLDGALGDEEMGSVYADIIAMNYKLGLVVQQLSQQTLAQTTSQIDRI